MKTDILIGRGKRLIYGSFLLLVFFYLFTIPTQSASEEKPIRIGTTWVLSGKWAVYGLDNKKGMEIALAEINEKGVLGRKLEIIWEDSAGEKTLGVALLRKFAADPEIPLVLQQSTGDLAAQAPVAKELKIPLISAGSVATGLPLNEWTFRVNLPVTAGVPIVIKGVKEKKGVRKIAVIYDMAYEFPTSEAKLVQNLIKEDKDLELVAFETFKTGDRDFAAQLAKIRKIPHDAFWISGTVDEVALILKQAREMGIKSLFIGGTSFVDPSIFKISGGAMAGAILSLQFSPSDPRPIVQRFVKKFEGIHKTSPPLYAALGYDTMLITADAIKRAGKLERKAIRDALDSTKSFEGLCGQYSYGGSPDNRTPGFKLYTVTEKNEYRPF